MNKEPHRFGLREAAGALGDLGTLFPLALGYIVICGMDPTGVLVMMGLANIVTGLVYRLPMPIEPMKVIAIVAIAQGWSPGAIHATAFTTGAIWVVLSLSGLVCLMARIIPGEVTRGIQVALGVMLSVEAVKLMASWWLLGIFSTVLILLLRKSRIAPAAIVLVAGGLILMALNGTLSGLSVQRPGLPAFSLPALSLAWRGMTGAGFAQLGLTAANAVIATTAIISRYWPQRRVRERSVALSTGLMNMVSPLFGGMPMCHGSGGLAAQYTFGARTGGANIIEGVMEVLAGVFLGGTITVVFLGFPRAVLGAMMLMVGAKLVLFARENRRDGTVPAFLLTVAASVFMNMAAGLVIGLLFSLLVKKLGARREGNS